MAGQVEVSTLNSYGMRRIRRSKNKLKMLTEARDKQSFVENSLQGIWNKHDRIRDLISGSRNSRRVAMDLMDIIDLAMSMGFRHDMPEARSGFNIHVKWLRDNGLGRYYSSLQKELEDLGIVDRSTTKPDEEVFSNFFGFWCEACRLMEDSATITFEGQKYFYLIELKRAMERGNYAPPMKKFDHILVDEFQDINILDMNLLKAIAKGHRTNLTIVGDDDQAIYEWRGASPEFILGPDRFLGSKFETYVLEKNYRSPRNIVEHSQSLIKHNKQRVEKSVSAANANNAHISVQRVPNLEASVQYVRSLVKQYLKNGTDVKSIALIGRKRSQIVPYQIVFASEGLPFYAAEDLQIFLSKAFEDLVDILFMKARQGSSNNSQMQIIDDCLLLCDRVFRYPLSKDDRRALKQHLIMKNPMDYSSALRALWEYSGVIKKRTGDKFAEAIRPIFEARTVPECIAAISENLDGMSKDYGKSLEDIFYTDPPFLYIAEYAASYGSRFADFVSDLQRAKATLAKSIPEDSEDQEASWKKPLHLMTALRAKGKEFDVVIVLDCNDGVWPSKLAGDDAIESERRLFYVAVTRARRNLHFVVDDKILGERVLPSPFLSEYGF
jgi:DNA helicase-2/ATP-dependent DNA helicase PcrA